MLREGQEKENCGLCCDGKGIVIWPCEQVAHGIIATMLEIMMEKIKLDNPEYMKVLVLSENDGRFDDAEEVLELKEVQAEDSNQ
ncbi:hypothetical protein RIF29_28834 [Crotalaria pallida]|uniref:Uncharacterized protein n=1 Tax=Crotalaria pallida TaxID=3830 RepID=A0AAN9EFK6_CROPI